MFTNGAGTMLAAPILAVLVAAVVNGSAGAQMSPPPIDPRTRADVLVEVEAARAAFEAAPEDVGAALTYARSLYESGEFEDARDVLSAQTAGEQVNEAASVEAMMLAGDIARLLCDYDESERLLRAVLEREPENMLAWRKLATLYYRSDQYERAGELPESLRLPHLDLMRAFDGEAPYQIEWADGDETVVPLIVADPLPLLSVRVDGVPVDVIVDTGGDSFVLDSSVADSLGIEAAATMMGMFGGGMRGEVGFARIEALQIGGATLRSVPISMLPLGRLEIGGRVVQGIIGTSVLRQFLATVDCPSGLLTLRARGGDSARAFASAAEREGAHQVPFVMASTHFIMARGELNGASDLTFHVDSGLAGDAAFSAPAQTLERAGIPLPEIVPTEVVTGAGQGTIEMASFPIEELSLGEAVVRDLVGSYGGLPPHSYWMLGFIQDGLISHQFLRNYAWTLDFDSMTMILEGE